MVLSSIRRWFTKLHWNAICSHARSFMYCFLVKNFNMQFAEDFMDDVTMESLTLYFVSQKCNNQKNHNNVPINWSIIYIILSFIKLLHQCHIPANSDYKTTIQLVIMAALGRVSFQLFWSTVNPLCLGRYCIKWSTSRVSLVYSVNNTRVN